jgi:hypothetical protein
MRPVTFLLDQASLVALRRKASRRALKTGRTVTISALIRDCVRKNLLGQTTANR